MAGDRHMEAARAVWKRHFLDMHPIVSSSDVLLIQDIATALANSERDGMRRAAEICRQEEAAYLTPEYTTDQPLGSISERVACRTCADSILSQAGEGDQ